MVFFVLLFVLVCRQRNKKTEQIKSNNKTRIEKRYKTNNSKLRRRSTKKRFRLDDSFIIIVFVFYLSYTFSYKNELKAVT